MGNSSSSNDHKLSPETQKQLQIDQSSDILAVDVDKQLEEKQGIVFYAKYKTFPHFYFWSCNVARPPGSNSNDDDKSSDDENKKVDDKNNKEQQQQKLPTTTTPTTKISSESGDVFLKCKIGVDDGRKEEEIPYTVDLWMKQDLKDGNYHVKPAPVNDSEFNRRFAQQIPESLQKRWFGQMEITENQVQKMMKKRERQLAKQAAAAAAAQEQKTNNNNNNNASSSLQQNQVMRAPIPAGIAESKQREDQRNSKNPSAASSIKKQVQRCHEVPQGLFEKGFVIGPKKSAMKIIEEYLPPSSLSSETSSKSENQSDSPQKHNKEHKVVVVSEKYWNADNFSDFTMLTWIVDEMNLQRNSRQSYSNPLEKLRQHLNDDD